MVAHIDLDAFFVACEIKKNPDLADKPVIIAGRGPRAVVATASYQARQYGVGSGMPASKARRLCRQGVFLPVDMKYYREQSGHVMELIKKLEIPWERASVDEVYLELTAISRPVETMRTLIRDIKEQLDLDASVGIGPNKLVAKIASDLDKPQGFVVLNLWQAQRRLASEPVKLIPGVGPKTEQRLHEIGIDTIEQLANAADETMQQSFGPGRGLELKERGWLHSDSPVAQRAAKSRSVETTFDYDLRDLDEMLEHLDKQSIKLSKQLQERQQAGRTISIKIRLKDFTTVTRAKTVAAATNDPKVIGEVAQQLLRSYYDPKDAIRLLGVKVSSFQ